MLPSTPQVEAVYLGENGLLAGLQGADQTSLSKAATELPWLVDGKIMSGVTDASTLFVDQTTLDPTGAKRVADTVHDKTGRKALMIDGPVSGGEREQSERSERQTDPGM
jgi:3-hydroxyisobutyrate dehydrogenase